MPAVPSSLIEPIWVEFAALLPARPAVDPAHPLGCHRRRIPDRVVFERVRDALVHGSGDERIATAACSDRTIRRRLKDWASWGVAAELHALCLAAVDKMIGLRLGDVSADGVITKAPCGGEKAGPSPVDRRKGGLKRSVAAEATGVPLGLVSAGANRHDSPLLAPTLAQMRGQVGALPPEVTVHLAGGDDSHATRALLDGLGFTGAIARTGIPAPVQAGKRWVVERLHARMKQRRQAPPLHRPRRRGRRLLPRPRRRPRHRPPTRPACPRPLPLGHPPHHTPSQVTGLSLDFAR